MMMSRTLSTCVWVAASISSTSMSRPSAISMHASQTPHESVVGPLTQLSARARIRAVVVLPTPRGPAKTYVRDALAGERVAKRLGDAALPDHILETRGPPFAGENLVGHLLGRGAPHRGPEDLRHMAGSA